MPCQGIPGNAAVWDWYCAEPCHLPGNRLLPAYPFVQCGRVGLDRRGFISLVINQSDLRINHVQLQLHVNEL